MSHKRFLRDNILDEMLNEIRSITTKIESTQYPTLLFSHSLRTVNEMYETNRTVLVILEDLIDVLRNRNPEDPSLDPIVESAAHIQIGLVSVHKALKDDVQQLVEVIDNLKNTITLEEESINKEEN